MKIFILGSHGILGRYATIYFQSKYEVVEFNHEDLNAATATYSTLYAQLQHAGIKEGDVIINCAGIIRPKNDANSQLETILVNTVFPRTLALVADSLGAKLIHPSVAYVFDGARGQYIESDVPNATDLYGKSKALGEPDNATIIRTAIIGEEINKKRTLVEWVKSNHDGEIPGYTNHLWNGITGYQFAKVCGEIVEKNLFWHGVRHIFSQDITKMELVTLISAIYSLNVKVIPKEAASPYDITLRTVYPNEPQILIPTIGSQVAEMREVERELYGLNLAE